MNATRGVILLNSVKRARERAFFARTQQQHDGSNGSNGGGDTCNYTAGADPPLSLAGHGHLALSASRDSTGGGVLDEGTSTNSAADARSTECSLTPLSALQRLTGVVSKRGGGGGSAGSGILSLGGGNLTMTSAGWERGRGSVGSAGSGGGGRGGAVERGTAGFDWSKHTRDGGDGGSCSAPSEGDRDHERYVRSRVCARFLLGVVVCPFVFPIHTKQTLQNYKYVLKVCVIGVRVLSYETVLVQLYQVDIFRVPCGTVQSFVLTL